MTTTNGPGLTDDEIDAAYRYHDAVEIAHAAMRKALWWAKRNVSGIGQRDLAREMKALGIEPWEDMMAHTYRTCTCSNCGLRFDIDFAALLCGFCMSAGTGRSKDRLRELREIADFVADHRQQIGGGTNAN